MLKMNRIMITALGFYLHLWQGFYIYCHTALQEWNKPTYISQRYKHLQVKSARVKVVQIWDFLKTALYLSSLRLRYSWKVYHISNIYSVWPES